jgi:hypothetical protein
MSFETYDEFHKKIQMIQVHKILCNPSVSMGFLLHAKGGWLPRLVPFGQNFGELPLDPPWGVRHETSRSSWRYPLVNSHITMENHHAIHGKCHYKW